MQMETPVLTNDGRRGTVEWVTWGALQCLPVRIGLESVQYLGWQLTPVEPENPVERVCLDTECFENIKTRCRAVGTACSDWVRGDTYAQRMGHLIAHDMVARAIEKPQLMICDHAGKCGWDCRHKAKHERNEECAIACLTTRWVEGSHCIPYEEERGVCAGCDFAIWHTCCDKFCRCTAGHEGDPMNGQCPHKQGTEDDKS